MRRNGLRGGALHSHLRQVEIEEIEAALIRNGWNVSATARELGRNRVGLTQRLQALGIHRPTAGAESGTQEVPSMSHRIRRVAKRRRAVTRGHQSDSAPGELAMRETTLYRFTDPADRAAVLRVGRMLHLHALEQPPAKNSDSAIRAALREAAQDLRNLQGFLEWVCREGDDTELGTSGVALTEMAHAYGKELGRIARLMEEGLDTRDARRSRP